MTLLTPEKEKEIRSILEYHCCISWEACLELLAEIDALRAQLKFRNETQTTGYCIRCENAAAKYTEGENESVN